MNSNIDRKTDSIKTGKNKAQRMKIQKGMEKYQMHIYLVIKDQSNAIIHYQLHTICYFLQLCAPGKIFIIMHNLFSTSNHIL